MTSWIRTIAVWMPIYIMSIATLLISVQYYQLPFNRKLEMLCPLDSAHLYMKIGVEHEYIGFFYTKCAQCGSNLTIIVYQILGINCEHLSFHCNSQDIFWIGVQPDLQPSYLYGPYQGTMWRKANDINRNALATATLSSIAIVAPLIFWFVRSSRLRAKPTDPPKALTVLG